MYVRKVFSSTMYRVLTCVCVKSLLVDVVELTFAAPNSCNCVSINHCAGFGGLCSSASLDPEFHI